MAKSKKIRPKKKNQIERFKAKAKELGADESGEIFERAFKKIILSPPSGIISRKKRS